MTPDALALQEAIEEVRRRARALGLAPDELYAQAAPLRLRAAAWLWETALLLRTPHRAAGPAVVPDLDQLLAGVGS